MSDVTRIGPKRGNGEKDLVFTEVRSSICRHSRFILDQKLSEVECADCGEKLNPMWVLSQIALQDSAIAQKRTRLRALVRQLSEKLKYKCRHCGKMNDMARLVKLKAEFEREEFIRNRS